MRLKEISQIQKIKGISGKIWIKGKNFQDIKAKSKKIKDYWPYDNKKIQFITQEMKKFYKKKKKIGIIGDYDVDGVSASALVKIFFEKIGWEHEIIIPNRFQDGYGPSVKLVKRLQKKGCKVILTLDSGTTAYDVINYLEKEKIPMFIFDHHHIPHFLKNPLFINSKQWLGDNNLEHLCATGLTFVILTEFNKLLKKPLNMLDYIDITAMATVCDVVPLIGLNRSIVHYGLKKYQTNPAKSLKILYSPMAQENLSSELFGYNLGPYINAAGRMRTGKIALNFLSTNSAEDRKKYATELIILNTDRKNQQKQIINSITIDKKSFIAVYGPWHEGIIGIIAGQLKEKYNKPTAIFNEKEGILKGSFRSPEGFNIGEFITKLKKKEIIIMGGGHACAGGCSMKKEKWHEFIEIFTETMKNIKIQKTIHYHGLLNLINLEKQLLQLKKYEPFGAGNKKPNFIGYGYIKIIRELLTGWIVSFSDNQRNLSFFVSNKYINDIPKGNAYILCNITQYKGKATLILLDISYENLN